MRRSDPERPRAEPRAALPDVANGYMPAFARDHRRQQAVHKGSQESEPFDIADVIEQVVGAVDANGRHWPRLQGPPVNRVSELECALEAQRNELSARCMQLADLCNVQQQAADLKVAHEAIRNLDGSLNLLQAALAQQEGEAAVAKQALAQAEQERDALRAQLERERKALQAELQQERQALQAQLERATGEAEKLRQQTLHLQKAFSTREAAIAAAQDKRSAAEAELGAGRAEAEKLRGTLEHARQSHADALARQAAQSGERIDTLNTALAACDQRIGALAAANDKLVERCDRLRNTGEAAETSRKHPQETVEAQAENIQFLETVLRVEREDAKRKSAELDAALARERNARTAAERTAAALRKDVVRLFSKLTATAKAAG
ncbi:MAG: hypothetical protein P8Y71_06930 [Pseudolabrys sp.]